MIETQFTQLVGATVPIHAAAMPGVPTIALVAAVANPGAVEMLDAPLLSPALYAGESVTRVTSLQPTAAIVAGAERLRVAQ